MSRNSDSNTFFSDHGEVDSETDTDGGFLEDILPIPTSEPPVLTGPAADPLHTSTTTLGTSDQEHDTSFRPLLDRPESRVSVNHRFRKITQVKAEDVSLKTEETESEAEREPQLQSRKRAGSNYVPKIDKKPAARRIVSQNPASGPSMTKGAIDYRERKVVEAEYEGRFASLLDADIVQQVDYEGGITPRGRIFKAGMRQLELNEQEREVRQLPTSMDGSAVNANLMARALEGRSSAQRDQVGDGGFVEASRLRLKLFIADSILVIDCLHDQQ